MIAHGFRPLEGEGYTVNIPWEVAANAKSPPADAEMLYAFDRLVMPYLDFYGPWPGAGYGDMIMARKCGE